MFLYHGTSRVFDSFDAGAQEGGQLGSAFYFTDNEAVAENFAVFRHVPEIRGFESQPDLDAFLRQHPDWTLSDQQDVGGKIVATFTTPESMPQVLTVELDVQRPLGLDETASADLVGAATAAGVPPSDWNSAGELCDAALEYFHGRPIEEEDDVTAANGELLAVVQAAGHDAVTRPDERNGVAHRAWIVFDVGKIRIVGRRALG